jgi:hypothetical protein
MTIRFTLGHVTRGPPSPIFFISIPTLLSVCQLCRILRFFALEGGWEGPGLRKRWGLNTTTKKVDHENTRRKSTVVGHTKRGRANPGWVSLRPPGVRASLLTPESLVTAYSSWGRSYDCFVVTPLVGPARIEGREMLLVHGAGPRNATFVSRWTADPTVGCTGFEGLALTLAPESKSQLPGRVGPTPRRKQPRPACHGWCTNAEVHNPERNPM